MPDETVVDAEVVVEDHQPDPPPEPPPSTAIARRERRSEVIRPLDGEQVVESFHQYQELLPKLLTASDYQQAEQGKRFVKKSGWRKIATAFDLDVVRVSEGVERDDAGSPVRAWAIYRAIAPSGRSMDGDGYCSADEPRFNREAGRKKLENDLRSTATTRAKNRAISDLVGMGDVSAEEVDAAAGAAAGAELPPWAIEATDERKKMMIEALTVVVGDRQKAIGICTSAKESIGVVPQILVMFSRALAASMPTPAQRAQAAAATETAPPADQGTLAQQLDSESIDRQAEQQAAEKPKPPFPAGSPRWKDAPAQAEQWCTCPQKLDTPEDAMDADCDVHGIPF